MSKHDYDTVAIYVFTCKQCGKEGRETKKQAKAEEQLCRKCRRLEQNKNQLALFEGKAEK